MGKKSIPAASLANLRPIPITQRSPEERIAICRKGQAAQREAIKRRQSIQDIAAQVLSMPCPQGMIGDADVAQAAVEVAKEQGTPLTLYQAVYLVQVAKAAKIGATDAATFVRDSAGDKPSDKVQADVSSVTSADMAMVERVARRIMQDEQAKKGPSK